MVKISRESGIKRFTLAFLVSSGSDCQAAWFPNLRCPGEHHRQPNWPAAKIRRRCHPFIWGRRRTRTCSGVRRRTQPPGQYQAAIDKYKVHMLDFDIESSAIKDPASVDRRNQALATCRRPTRAFSSPTLSPCCPRGCSQMASTLLKNSLSHGVGNRQRNIMTMDYETMFAPNAMGRTQSMPRTRRSSNCNRSVSTLRLALLP